VDKREISSRVRPVDGLTPSLRDGCHINRDTNNLSIKITAMGSTAKPLASLLPANPYHGARLNSSSTTSCGNWNEKSSTQSSVYFVYSIVPNYQLNNKAGMAGDVLFENVHGGQDVSYTFIEY
jgi:hypothetical protein